MYELPRHPLRSGERMPGQEGGQARVETATTSTKGVSQAPPATRKRDLRCPGDRGGGGGEDRKGFEPSSKEVKE